MPNLIQHLCPDCGVREGYWHWRFCDQETCGRCGWQFISCECHPNARRHTRYLQWPNICARCGQVDPDFFSVSCCEWTYYIPKDQQESVICQECYDYIKQLVENATYSMHVPVAHP